MRQLHRRLVAATYRQLSILYLRCGSATPRRRRRLCLSFNSLFEMLVDAVLESLYGKPLTFNSLFEMPPRHRRRQDAPYCHLSILYLRCSTLAVADPCTRAECTFNSLFEMHVNKRRLKLHEVLADVLSILYLRCHYVVDWPHADVAGRLSILYLRCPPRRRLT